MLRLVLSLVVVLLIAVSCVSGGSKPGAPSSGVDPQLMYQLEALLKAQLAAQGGKGVADVIGEYIDCPPAFVGGDAVIGWAYNNTGDYDQNSEVNASDLVPIGINFNATSSDGNWPEAMVADGDDNGEVNFADVTPIGVNFGSVVTNYVIEADIDGAPTWVPVDNAPFSEGAPSMGSMVKVWNRTIPDGERAIAFRVYAGPAVPESELYDLSTVTPAEPVTSPDNWTELVLSPANENWGANNAVALVDGKPAVVYTRDDRDEIHYAYATVAKPTQPSDWVSSLVDDSDNLGGTLSLCEVQGVPCVSYEDTTMSDVFVAIATSTTPGGSTDWNVHEPDSSAIDKMQLANVAGNLHLVYRGSSGKLMHGRSMGPGLPDDPADYVLYELDVDENYDFLQIASVDGRPAVAYKLQDGDGSLVFAQAGSSEPTSAADWSFVVIDDTDNNSGKWVRLSVNQLGYPVIGYTNVQINDYLKYAYADSEDATSLDSWTIITVYQQAQTYIGQWLGLGTYENRPLLSYIETGSGSTDGLHVAYATENPPAGPEDFTRGILDPGGTYFVNEDTNVLMLNDGTPAVFYRTSEGLKYLYFTPPE